MKVGFIGAGRMGRPMVTRLVEAGHDVRVPGRSAEKRSAIAQLGAKAVADTAEVSTQADAIVVHTTGSPRTVEAIAAQAASRDVDVVDAPVSGGPHTAAAGALTLFVGGADDAVARLHPVLSCYGDPVLHVGPLGAGQKVKLVNNALFAVHIGLLSSAAALGVRLGISESALLAALPHGSAASRVLELVAAGGSVTSFVETAGEFVAKDAAVARSIAAELGSDLGVLDDAIDAAVPG